jgi:hypothetical protein
MVFGVQSHEIPKPSLRLIQSPQIIERPGPVAVCVLVDGVQRNGLVTESDRVFQTTFVSRQTRLRYINAAVIVPGRA